MQMQMIMIIMINICQVCTPGIIITNYRSDSNSDVIYDNDVIDYNGPYLGSRLTNGRAVSNQIWYENKQ